MKKEKYTAPMLEITELSASDIITLSSSGSGSSSGGHLEWVDEDGEW